MITPTAQPIGLSVAFRLFLKPQLHLNDGLSFFSSRHDCDLSILNTHLPKPTVLLSPWNTTICSDIRSQRKKQDPCLPESVTSRVMCF